MSSRILEVKDGLILTDGPRMLVYISVCSLLKYWQLPQSVGSKNAILTGCNNCSLLITNVYV